MEVLKLLLSRLGLPSRAGWEVQGNEEHLPVTAPQPTHLTPSQS
jgi:hypothetical protein